MGKVISLDAYRASKGRRNPLVAAPLTAVMDRLDGAVRRLDPLVRGRDGHLAPSVARELAAIAQAVSFGFPREAAERAERLADLLEHPALGGSGA